MEFSVKGIILIICIMAVTVYLAVAAIEDRKSMEVTRIRHLIGFVPAVTVFIQFFNKHTVVDVAIVFLFVVLFLICGKTGMYGLADGFVFSNLTLLFGGIGGVPGIGLVILIMILAEFSCLAEMLLCGKMTWTHFWKNKQVAFIPHILNGYMAVIIALNWMR